MIRQLIILLMSLMPVSTSTFIVLNILFLLACKEYDYKRTNFTARSWFLVTRFLILKFQFTHIFLAHLHSRHVVSLKHVIYNIRNNFELFVMQNMYVYASLLSLFL